MMARSWTHRILSAVAGAGLGALPTFYLLFFADPVAWWWFALPILLGAVVGFLRGDRGLLLLVRLVAGGPRYR